MNRYPNDRKNCKTADRKIELDDYLRDVMIRNRKDKLNQEEIKKIELSEIEQLNYLLLRDLILTNDLDDKKMISTQLCELVSNSESLKQSFRSKKGLSNTRRTVKYEAIAKYFGENHLYKNKLKALIEIINTTAYDKKNIFTVFCSSFQQLKK